MRIAFLTPNLNFRGTCIAIQSYAHYTKILLGHDSIIITKQDEQHDEIAHEYFNTTFMYQTREELTQLLIHQNIDILYVIKYGKNDGVGAHDAPNVRNVIHCVFDMSQPHGDVYAAVSSSLARRFGSLSVVPHMIPLDYVEGKDLRSELSIPSDAIVFGRHGGIDTFNLEWAKETFSLIVRNRSDIHFVFLNAPEWDDHPNIHYLSPTLNPELKKCYIRTCDAMVVPETMGHTCGLAIMEMSVFNKPIICYNGKDVWNTAHIDALSDKGIYFSTQHQLYMTLYNFRPSNYIDKDLNAFKRYTPENVMRLFERVFIQGVKNPYVPFKNKHIGKTAYIIGGGSSVSKCTSIPKDAIVIGCNQAYLSSYINERLNYLHVENLYDKAVEHVSDDVHIFFDHKPNFTTPHGLNEMYLKPNTYPYSHNFFEELGFFFRQVGVSCTGFIATCLANYMGCSQIVLVGMDCGHDHFYDKSVINTNTDFSSTISGWGKLNEILDAHIFALNSPALEGVVHKVIYTELKNENTNNE